MFAQKDQPPPPLQASILLVDDHEANLIALQAILEPLGQRLVSVTSAAEALRALLKQEFAVVMMDVRMSEMDGLEAARLIQARRQVVPIIFITAFADSPGDMLRGYEVGAVDYVTKPCDPVIVRAKVAVFVQLWRAKEELRQSAVSIAERDRDLAARDLEAREREKFIGVLGHDLRNPLSAITAGAELLLMSEQTDKDRVLLRRIKQSAARMGRMIGDVLDFTRGRLGDGIPVRLGPCDIGWIVAAAIEELRTANPTRSIHLQVDDGGVSGRCDVDRIAQAVANLVSNALAHGQDPVMVRTGIEDRVVYVEVANDGPSIPADIMPRLFEPFVHDSSADGGLGLGLYIVSEIIRAHGGAVRVRSEPGEPTTFRATWPR